LGTFDVIMRLGIAWFGLKSPEVFLIGI
jgi:hypothetical protein